MAILKVLNYQQENWNIQKKTEVKSLAFLLKKDCSTYGEVDQILKRARQDATWKNDGGMLQIITEVKELFESEKDDLSLQK